MSADSPRRSSGSVTRSVLTIPAMVPPQAVNDRSILDSAIGFINEVTLAHQPPIDPKDTITWARFETTADISDPRFGEDWELEGNVAPPLLLILGYGLGVQVWAIPANGEAVEVLSWRHGIVSALRVLPTPLTSVANEENSRADEPIDAFGEKRPLIALVDGNSTSGSQPQFCAVNFISLKTGAQVKTIKFKNPVIDILANRSSVVITFHERVAVFDARTLEDRLSITTCYPSPGINPNPIALGPRWLAYAENKILHSKRSGGGCDGDGVASYTATVLNASKSLVKGLRELGEQVAAGFTGASGSMGNSKNTSFDSGCGLDTKQSGVVTIIDIKNPLRDCSPISSVPSSSSQTAGSDTIIAHFIAHSEALVAMEFDLSGMLLVTADRRGHDFHVFRIQPNPVGSSLAAVHHLYILHRGDTSAKVQNITLTLDSRWVGVSTLRGTTHVFPITPYGGNVGVRTHSSLHVVNKLSRFHRSAGLSGEGRSNSPISHSESTTFNQSLQPYHNSTLPPYPRPTVVMPLAQIRQPFALGSPPGSASLAGVKSVTSTSGPGTQRQRLSSLSDDNGKPLSVCAIFAKSRSWLLDPPNVTREAPHRMQRRAVDSLFVMAGHGALIQYDLGTKFASNVAKEKICDDTPIELEVEAKAQWNLGRRKEGSQEIIPPLTPDNWLIKNRNSCILNDSSRQYDDSDERNDSWLAQVEIITHAGPHRRLWMGPQFVFKTYNTPSGSNLNHVDIEAVEIGTVKPSSTSSAERIDHSSPLNMPLTGAGRAGAVPVLIESGSYSSIEQSPKLMDRFRHDHLDSDYSVSHGDSRLKEDLADAMRESPSAAAASSKDAGDHVCESGGSSDNVAFYDALTAEDEQVDKYARSASAAALASVLPNIHSYENISSYQSLDLAKKPKASIAKIVNPLGTVTTVTSCLTADVKTDILDEVVSQLATEDTIIHENCDESLFRPVVAIFCDEKTLRQNEEEARRNNEIYHPPETISNKLVVPVIVKEINDELSKREKEKSSAMKSRATTTQINGKEQKNLGDLLLLNKKRKEDKKGNMSIDNEIEETNAQKIKTSVIKRENPADPFTENIYEKKEMGWGCSKNTTPLNEASTEIKIKNVYLQKDAKETPKQTVVDKDIETVVVSLQKIRPKMEFRKQDRKELENSSKNYDSDAKYTVTKDETSETKSKTKPLNSNDPNKQRKLKDNTAKVSKENTDKTSVNERSADSKLIGGASDYSKGNQKDMAKTKMDNDNKGSESQPTSRIAIKTNTTAMKGKAKQTADSITSDKLTNQFNVSNQKTGDDSVEIEKNEQRVEKNESTVSSNKTEPKNIALTANPFVCEKKGSPKSEFSSGNLVDGFSITTNELQCDKIDLSEECDVSKFPESMASTIEQQETNFQKGILKQRSSEEELSCNNNCVELKKSGKSKGIIFLDKKQKITENDTSVNKKSDSTINKKPVLDHKHLKEVKADFESLNPHTEYKDKSLNTKSESDYKVIAKTKCNEKQFSESIKQTEYSCVKNHNDFNSRDIDNATKVCNQSIYSRSKPEKLKTKNVVIDVKTNEIEKNAKIVASAKLQIKDKAADCELISIQDKNNEINTKVIAAQEMKKPGKDTKRNELSDTKPDTKTDIGEIKNNIPTQNSASPKKKAKEFRNPETKKDLCKKNIFDLNTFDKENIEKNEIHVKKEIVKEDKSISPSNHNERELLENPLHVCRKPNEVVKKMQITAPPSASAWKTLNGADVINRNLKKSDRDFDEFPLLGAISKINNFDKLLPELPTPADIGKETNLDEFSVLKSLDPLPPLPALEPLQFMAENKSVSSRDVSLMTFESPLLENSPSSQQNITPAPRGFTEQNLIFALCGSLHYENEHVEKTELSPPAFSPNSSSTVFEDTSVADYKSLTENDDPYVSLEQSSQDTNTTTTNTTNEKFSSSTNSSGSEEIVIMEEKKMTKKQKRKKQLQLKEFQKQNHRPEMDDEELRPLIAMTDSQVDCTTTFSNANISASAGQKEKSFPNHPLVHSTTTDSEGPLPATTSDENIFSIPVPMVHNPHKIKTKKLEHKINLIAAIEAATSSSTSSAEESGVELGGRSVHDNGEPLISVVNSLSTSTMPLPIVATSQTTVGALKKKTKRRKR